MDGTDVVPGYGPEDADFAVVGEAPGYQESVDGRPFVGVSGTLLRKTLLGVGLDPDRAYFTNVIKEYKHGNPTPTTKEINAARTELALELGRLPKLRAVLLVGNTPLMAVSGHGGVTKNRGLVKAFHRDWLLDLPTFATLHPAAVSRNSNLQHGFTKDLAAFRLLVEPPVDRDIIVPLMGGVGGGSMKDFIAALKKATRGAIDIETTVDKEGESFRSGVTMVSVAMTFDGETSWVVPFTTHPEGWIEVEGWLHVMREYGSHIEWTMHNGYLDRLRLRQQGWDPILKHDTMAMAYVINPDERKGLEFLSAVHLGEPPYKGVDYKTVLQEPMDRILQMNGKDALRTWRLFFKLADQLNAKPELSRIYQTLLMPALNAYIEVTEQGVPIDILRLKELTAKVSEEMDTLMVEVQRTAGRDINPRSTQQLAKLWFEDWGLPIIKRTDTGSPSTDTETRKTLLRLLPKNHPRRGHLEAIERYKTLATRMSTYLNGWPKWMDDSGRVHPTFKLLFVVTGRTSSSDPNIQNVPHESDYRRVFGGVPGYTWVKADMSQIELRIAAHVSQDPVLLQAYREGADIHMMTAKLVLGEETPEARYNAKTLNFGLLYGAGPQQLQNIAFFEYGVWFELDLARRHRDRFFREYAGLRRWHQQQISKMRSEGKSVSPIGRVRYLPDLYSDDSGKRAHAEMEGINHPIQSLANDITLYAMTRIVQQLPEGAHVISTIHDEINLLVRDDLVPQVVALVQREMEDPEPLRRVFGLELTVPLVADVSIGTHWSE